jgi:hypothetical protein
MKVLELQALIDLIKNNKELYADDYVYQVDEALSRPVCNDMKDHLTKIKNKVKLDKIKWCDGKIKDLEDQIVVELKYSQEEPDPIIEEPPPEPISEPEE